MQQVEAKYYSALSEKKAACLLCPHSCLLKPGERGICNVRENKDGKLIAKTYGMAVGLGIDPIEKKPLYHFFPGRKILSIGTPGCNLSCSFCQNSDISQVGTESFNNGGYYMPEELLRLAINTKDNIGIAFTYNEPCVFFEYMLDTAMLFKANNLKTVMVSNGYINPEPLQELLPYIDGFNIDLKSFSDKFYRSVTGSSLLPVLETIKMIQKNGNHLELTYLLIPRLNDSKSEFREMLRWIKGSIGKDTVLHLSRYFPRHKSNIPATPVKLMKEFYSLAKDYLNYLYLGNVSGVAGQETRCKVCNELCISRDNYNISSFLTSKGECPGCQNKILHF
jgi:pyruvate formate lyase activating enzyme